MLTKIFDFLLLDRETYELAQLNKIWADFNDKKATAQESRSKIYSRRWKYHHDKIDIFIMMTNYLMK